MQKKSKFRWLDAQIVIAALAVTASLALWNVFAAAARHPVLGPISIRMAERLYKNTATAAVATPVPTTLPSVTPGLTQIHLPPLHLLLGGHAPVVQVVVVSNRGGSSGGQASSVSGTGGGGGPVSNPPPPVTTTASSHP
jgi:hypothetical protein